MIFYDIYISSWGSFCYGSNVDCMACLCFVIDPYCLIVLFDHLVGLSQFIYLCKPSVSHLNCIDLNFSFSYGFFYKLKHGKDERFPINQDPWTFQHQN